MKRIYSIILFSFLILNVYGQKIKYKDVKNSISTAGYRYKVENPRYSLLLAGSCNFLLPSSGYFYTGEPVRGLSVLGGMLLSGGVFMYGLINIMNFDPGVMHTGSGSWIIMFSGLIAMDAIYIWSIFDVIKVAKVKNLAFQDPGISLSISPAVLSASQRAGIKSAGFGLQLHLNF